MHELIAPRRRLSIIILAAHLHMINPISDGHIEGINRVVSLSAASCVDEPANESTAVNHADETRGSV